MKCKLCDSEFKGIQPLNVHLMRKTACVSAQSVIDLLDAKDNEIKTLKDELKELRERVTSSEEHSDMFRKLHVRTQKQLAAWRNEHKKCSVTLEKQAAEDAPYYAAEQQTAAKPTVSVEEFFSSIEKEEADKIAAMEARKKRATENPDSSPQQSYTRRSVPTTDSAANNNANVTTNNTNANANTNTNDPFTTSSNSFSFRPPSTSTSSSNAMPNGFPMYS